MYFTAPGFSRKSILGGEISKLAVVGSDYAGVYQAMFYADNPNISYYNKVPRTCLS